MQKRVVVQTVQVDWTESQKKLIDHGVKDSDVNALKRAQMMTKLIESLKKHNGPLNSEEEIDDFLKKHKKCTDKELARMLNDEIRFRRDSNLRYSVSKDCYLYRQRGISNELRVKNLRLLVQRPEARSSATIEDLRSVILSEDSTSGLDCTILQQSISASQPQVNFIINAEILTNNLLF